METWRKKMQMFSFRHTVRLIFYPPPLPNGTMLSWSMTVHYTPGLPGSTSVSAWFAPIRRRQFSSIMGLLHLKPYWAISPSVTKVSIWDYSFKNWFFFVFFLFMNYTPGLPGSTSVSAWFAPRRRRQFSLIMGLLQLKTYWAISPSVTRVSIWD